MQSSLADLLEAWHDFDLLIGTAAATLVGLMFVAASIGASVFMEKDRAAMKAFISPTVVHFSAVLVVAMVSLIPSHDWPALAGLLLAATSIWVVFTITAATYLWSALCLLRIPADSRPAETEPAPITSELLAGFRAIAAHPALRVVVGLTAAQTLVAGAFEVQVVDRVPATAHDLTVDALVTESRSLTMPR